MAERLITADDVVRAGACRSGVMDVVERIGSRLAAAMPVSVVLKFVEDDERDYVLRAAELNGNGDGYGDGDGYGCGNGYSYGYGYSYGCGYGDGDGYGNGDGHGDGDSDGYGNGNGHGDGSYGEDDA